MGVRPIVCASLCAVATACLGGSGHSSSPHARLPVSQLIVPGSSLAGISTGESRASVEAKLGRGMVKAHTTANGKDVGYQVAYPDARLVVDYATLVSSPAPVVVQVTTRSTRYHTRTGIEVGTRVLTVARLPGVVCEPTASTSQTFTHEICNIRGGPGFPSVETSPVTPVLTFGILHGRVHEIALIAMVHADGRLAKPNPRLVDW